MIEEHNTDLDAQVRAALGLAERHAEKAALFASIAAAANRERGSRTPDVLGLKVKKPRDVPPPRDSTGAPITYFPHRVHTCGFK